MSMASLELASPLSLSIGRWHYVGRGPTRTVIFTTLHGPAWHENGLADCVRAIG